MKKNNDLFKNCMLKTKCFIFNFMTICVVISSCAPQNSIRSIKKSTHVELYKNFSSDEKSDSLIINKSFATIPTKDAWIKDRDAFANKIENYLTKNNQIMVKAKKRNNTISITGTAIGVGGGVYGLFVEDKDITPSITSILVGGLTTITGQLGLGKTIKKADNCNVFLNTILLDFKYTWGDISSPTTQKDLQLYLDSKKDVIDRIKNEKCF